MSDYYYTFEEVKRVAAGNWVYILGALAPALGPALERPGRHVECPFHGGKRDFRVFPDVNEKGSAYCTCGNWSDGFNLLTQLNAWDNATALMRVGDFVGAPKHMKRSSQSEQSAPQAEQSGTPVTDPAPQGASLETAKSDEFLAAAAAKAEQSRQRQIKQSENAEKSIQRTLEESVNYINAAAQPVREYLRRRGVGSFRSMDFDVVRCHPKLAYYDEDMNKVGEYPAMVCPIQGPDGEVVTLHRTYLTRNGNKPRLPKGLSNKKMSSIPHGKNVVGGAIRLTALREQHTILSVGEGLETTASAARIYPNIPAWCLVNTALLEGFVPPQQIKTIIVWADKDRSTAGERAAIGLRDRMAPLGVQVLIMLPGMPIPTGKKGVDWNDVLLEQGFPGFPQQRRLNVLMGQKPMLEVVNTHEPTPEYEGGDYHACG